MKHELPQTELTRLEALHSLEILDSPPEERFDRITRLVSEIFGVPIATVSLVDENRQWFKSSCGLDVSETPREIAFCAHAIHVPDIMVVPDATMDPRFSSNPLVTHPPFIRFYAGAIVKTSAGVPLGTLCVIDTRPREFSESQKQQLISFANIVSSELSPNFNVIQARTQSHLASNLDQSTGFHTSREFATRCEAYLRFNANATFDAAYCGLLEIPNYDVIAEQRGEAVAEKIITKAAQVLAKTLDGHYALYGRLDRKTLAVFTPVLSYSRAETASILLDNFSFMESIPGRPKILFGFSAVKQDMADALAQCRIALRNVSKCHPLDCKFFDEQDEALLSRSRVLTKSFIQEIRDNALTVFYQPKISVTSNRIVSCEALLRWNSRQLGPISPLHTLQAAQTANMVKELDSWVLEAVCAQIADWASSNVDPVPVAVNLSGESLQDETLPKRIAALLEKYKIPARLLHLEILETAVIEDFEQILPILNSIQAMGVRFSLDDFGTGYSSLRYLQKLPVSALKIDREFIKDITLSTEETSLTASMIALGHSLHMVVIAEGVETAEQYEVLKTLRCDLVQGFLFSKAVSAANFSALLNPAHEWAYRSAAKA